MIKYELRYLPLFYDDLVENVNYIRYSLMNGAAADALIDAVETAKRYGICKDRAVNYNADGAGTQILYESVAKAVCNVRSSAPLKEDWSKDIDEDYKRRGKKVKAN